MHAGNTSEGWDKHAEDYGASIPAITSLYAADALKIGDIEKYLHNEAKNTFVILDVGAGTGALSLPLGRLIKRLREENEASSVPTLAKDVAEVIASDFSPQMVSIIAKRAEAEGLIGIIQPRVLDGMALALEDNSVDIAFSNFGVFLISDRAKALSELFRVVKPGSAVVLTSWKPPLAPNLIYSEVLKRHAEEQQQQPESSPPLKLPMADEKDIKGDLKQAGFRDVCVTCCSHDWLYETHDTFVTMTMSNPMMVGMREKVGPRFQELLEKVLKEQFPVPFTLPTYGFVTVGFK